MSTPVQSTEILRINGTVCRIGQTPHGWFTDSVGNTTAAESCWVIVCPDGREFVHPTKAVARQAARLYLSGGDEAVKVWVATVNGSSPPTSAINYRGSGPVAATALPKLPFGAAGLVADEIRGDADEAPWVFAASPMTDAEHDEHLRVTVALFEADLAGRGSGYGQ
jgi:hypothetical protein